MQRVYPDSDKRFAVGADPTGHYYPIGQLDGALVIAEGYATAATVHETTGTAIAVAFYAGNLRPVAEALRAKLGPGVRLTIAADADDAGMKTAREAAEAVGAALAVPVFRPGEEGTDFNDLAALAGRGAVRAAFAEAAEAHVEDEWPEPDPIPGLPPVEPFTADMLPVKLRPWIEDVAERAQCPLDYPGTAVMIGLSALVGRRLAIRPKQYDNWTVVPNLWGYVVGPPGVLKTPAVREALRPLYRLAAEAREVHKGKLAEYEADQEEYEDRLRVWRKSRRAKIEGAVAEVDERPKAPERPTCRRYVINDATVEKLGEILVENPVGVLLFRDELVGFWRMLDRKGHESDRAFYLEAWDGLGDFTYDRIGRGSVYLPSTTVSVFGCLTPGSLGAYLRAAMDGGSGDDGWIQRYQLAIWPELPPGYTEVDRWPESEARRAAYELFARLDNLDPEAVGANMPDEKHGVPYLRFTPDALEVFRDWRGRLERLLRGGNLDDHPSLVAHFAKYRSLIPSLALLVHLGNGETGNVSGQALDAALKWDRYLRPHAVRMFASARGTDPRYVHERMALDRLLAMSEADRTVAGLHQWAKRWRGIEDTDDTRAVVQRLARRNLLRIRAPEPSGKAGRPQSERIDLSPFAQKYAHSTGPTNLPKGEREGSEADIGDSLDLPVPAFFQTEPGGVHAGHESVGGRLEPAETAPAQGSNPAAIPPGPAEAQAEAVPEPEARAGGRVPGAGRGAGREPGQERDRATARVQQEGAQGCERHARPIAHGEGPDRAGTECVTRPAGGAEWDRVVIHRCPCGAEVGSPGAACARCQRATRA